MEDSGGQEIQETNENEDEEANDAVKTLKEVRASLNENGRGQLDPEIREVAEECTQRGDLSLKILLEINRNFVNVVAVTLGFNLETTKKIVSIFNMCWTKQGLAEKIIKEVYTEDEDETPEVDEQMPIEIQGMEDSAIALYAKALNQGFEEVQRIRLMVVGMFSVGKTSLVNNLVEDLSNKKPPEVLEEDQFPPSTEGIDVHLCIIDQQNKWRKQQLSRKPLYEDRLTQAQFEDLPTVHDEHMDFSRSEDYYEEDEETPMKNVIDDQEDQPTLETNNDFKRVYQNVQQRKNEPDVKAVLEVFKEKNNEENEKPVDAKPPITGREPLVSVWDFAGQNLYYSTHHFFLNKRSIYLLLMNMTKSLDTDVAESASLSGLLHKHFTCLDSFKFWLNSIHMYSSIHDQEYEVHPTVILVGTHKDKMKCSEEDKEDKMNEFFDKALESFIDTPILKHIHEKKFLVNNLQDRDPVFNELRAEVKMLAEKQHYWNEKSPVSFIELEKSFDTMREEGKELINYTDVQAANRNNIKTVDEPQLRLFLELQHMFGNILHFDTPELKQFVILAPKWIIEAFKCFITHKHTHNKKPEHLHLWKEYKLCAIIKPPLLEEIIQRSNERIRIHGKAVIQYMEHLNVMAKPLCTEELDDEDDDDDDTSTVAENRKVCLDSKSHKPEFSFYNTKMLDFHIVPCQLQAKPDDEIIEKIKSPSNWHTTPALCFVFNDNFMPPAVFHRLLAACIRSWEIAKDKTRSEQRQKPNEQTLLFNGIGVFKTCKRSQLRIWYHDHIIYGRMAFMSQCKDPEKAIDKVLCQNVRRTLYKHLMAILGLLPRSKHITKTAPYEEYIQCPKLTDHNCGLFRVNDFIIDGEMSCDEGHDLDEAHPIEKSSVLKYWFSDAMKEMEEIQLENLFEGIDLEKVPEDDELSVIGRGLAKSKEFWLLGIELGIKQVTMELLKRDHFKVSRETFIYHMLYEWKKTKQEPLSKLVRKIHAVHKNSTEELGSILECLKEQQQRVI
ncbi:PATS1-like protein [Mya arenaria]|uniref:non-specific serine/threonine protein kinase n=1 Tax=Mya arenaria TaxID=6604 RepID=A0ABY7DHN6_MYAAR|nr:uncharacterized protein LOC128217906 [Mya arenaria]WAQ95845.1 PATS1-like protein [Mya arenaria]